MKHYVSAYKIVGTDYVGMAVAGPFNTRNEANNWVTTLTPKQHKEYPCCQLTVGPDDLGPTWKKNLKAWKLQ